MINTQFGGKIGFTIQPGGKFVLDEASQGKTRLLEEAQDIFDSVSLRAEQMARLDNLGPEAEPVRPGFFEGLFHPSRVREYQAKQSVWDAQAHGTDHASEPGSVELKSDSNDLRLDASLGFRPGEPGRYGGVALEQMKYSRIDSYSYDDGSDAAGVNGPSQRRDAMEVSMKSEGGKDILQCRLDNGFVGLRTVTIDWETGRGEMLGQVSRSDQGEFYLPELDTKPKYIPTPIDPPTAAPVGEPEMSWADRQALNAYNNSSWKGRQRLDYKAGGDYRATVQNLDNLSWRQRQRTEYRLGL